MPFNLIPCSSAHSSRSSTASIVSSDRVADLCFWLGELLGPYRVRSVGDRKNRIQSELFGAQETPSKAYECVSRTGAATRALRKDVNEILEVSK